MRISDWSSDVCASDLIRLEEEASHDWPKIWFPILAEDVSEQLERIHSRIAPDDVCPVLPLQSVDPRRGDNIIREMGELVFDRMAVTPRDIIFATERSEEHTSELQSLMRISYAVFCLKKKKFTQITT